MASRCRKRRHKVDALLSKVSTQDQVEFAELCQWNPTYAALQGWFLSRGHRISLNAIHHWWRSNYPDCNESKVLKGIAMQLEDFDKRPYDGVRRLVTMAAQVLADHTTGKLANTESHTLMETQLELFALVRSLSMSRLSKF